MSYFVLKGPAGAQNYLCRLPEHSCPQWWPGERSKAIRFPDEQSAWDFLALVRERYPDGSWTGRPVRVNTMRDYKAQVQQLHLQIAGLRGAVALKDLLLKSTPSDPIGGGE